MFINESPIFQGGELTFSNTYENRLQLWNMQCHSVSEEGDVTRVNPGNWDAKEIDLHNWWGYVDLTPSK